MTATADLPVLAELARTGKLTQRQQKAVARLSRAYQGERGRSCPGTNYSGSPRSQRNTWSPNTYWTPEAETMSHLKQHLRPHEREMLAKVCTPALKPWDIVIAIGTAAGYKQLEQTRAAGVGLIQALVNSIADVLRVPADEERIAA